MFYTSAFSSLKALEETEGATNSIKEIGAASPGRLPIFVMRV
jgi:hypothetical protein